MCQLHGSSLSTKSQHPGHPMTQSLSSATCVICRDSWLPRRSVIPACGSWSQPWIFTFCRTIEASENLEACSTQWFSPPWFFKMFHIQMVRNWRPLSNFWMNANHICWFLPHVWLGNPMKSPDVFGLNPQIKPLYHIYISYILLFEFHTHPFIVCKSDVMSLEHPFIILYNCIPSIIHIKSPWKVEIIHIKCSNPWSFEPPDIEASAASRVRRSPRCCILLPIR